MNVPATLMLMATTSSLVSACMPANHNDLDAYIAAVKSSTVAAIVKLPERSTLVPQQYYGEQQRNPFEAKILRTGVAAGIDSLTCRQPDLPGARLELENFSLDQLRFSGTLRTNNSSYIALVISADGRLHRVTQGTYIGPNYGRVSAVSSHQIDIQQWTLISDSCWQQRHIQLPLRVSPRSF